MSVVAHIAGCLVAGVLLLGPVAVVAGPAAPAPGADSPAPPAPASEPGSDRGAVTVNVPAVRRKMEQDMAQLGRLAQDARKKGDMVRLGCIRDKQERAHKVMEVATGELLVLRDSNATEQAKGFAGEKLQAAGQRLRGLVDAALACSGEQAPEEEGLTKNDLDRDSYIPYEDPTAAPTRSPLPPSVDDTLPPLVESPVM